MREKGSATFYVQASIRGAGDTELLVDTGSGYVTISENTLSALKHAGGARYVRTLQGVMADGRQKVVRSMPSVGSTSVGTVRSVKWKRRSLPVPSARSWAKWAAKK